MIFFRLNVACSWIVIVAKGVWWWTFDGLTHIPGSVVELHRLLSTRDVSSELKMNEELRMFGCKSLSVVTSQSISGRRPSVRGNNGCWTHLPSEVPRNVVILKAGSLSLLLANTNTGANTNTSTDTTWWCSCGSCARTRSGGDHPSEVGTTRVHRARPLRHRASQRLCGRRQHSSHGSC